MAIAPSCSSFLERPPSGGLLASGAAPRAPHRLLASTASRNSTVSSRFFSDQGVVVTMLEGALATKFLKTIEGRSGDDESRRILRECAFQQMASSNLTSASFLRHDLPVAVAGGMGRVGLAITPRQRMCAFAGDAESGYHHEDKVWMQRCLHRCASRHDASASSTASPHLRLPSGTSSSSAYCQQPAQGMRTRKQQECQQLGVSVGTECALNSTLSAEKTYAHCVCYERWEEAFAQQKANLDARAANGTSRHNEVFLKGFSVDAVFYTTGDDAATTPGGTVAISGTGWPLKNDTVSRAIPHTGPTRALYEPTRLPRLTTAED